MIIKETEALKFNCHYPDASHCAGARCMAWRWADEKNDDYKPHHPMIAMTPQHPADGPSPFKKSATHGYCGLAGRP